MNKIFVIILVTIMLYSCTSETGYEFMPNMYRSPSLETYSEDHLSEDNKSARLPVTGTISRGNLSTFNFSNNLDGYLEAGRLSVNPLENNIKNQEDGKKLYSMFCEHCHGVNGAGGGTVNHPIYSAVPHYNDKKQIRRTGGTMAELNDGHIFHAITYGLNAMGPHASQITEEERWKIVLHVKELQNYNSEE